MGNALSRVAVALVFMAMLMSTTHFTQAYPANYFQGLADVREEGLSRFNERDLFNSDNNYANDDFEPSERNFEYGDENDNDDEMDQSERTLEDNDEDQLNQIARTLEDDNELDQSERSLEDKDDELDQGERTINDDDDLEQSKRMFQDDDDAEELYQYERSIQVDGADTVSAQIFGENEKQKRKDTERSRGSQGKKNDHEPSKVLKDCFAECLPKNKDPAERIKCTRECAFRKLN